MSVPKYEIIKENPQQHHVCPWWLCFTFDNIFRRLFHNPEQILTPYVKAGCTVLDVGPGMGYFTIPLAKLVGDSGKVIAADLQKKMLNAIFHRAQKVGVQRRIELHLCTSDSIGISESIDFCLAFYMVHEVPDRARFLGEIISITKQNGLLLLVEPKLHVTKEEFIETLKIAKGAGLFIVDRPKIFFSYSALLKKEF